MQGRECSAYGLFSCFPEYFSALLEDPSGNGRQFLTSRSGVRHSLDTVEGNDGDNFFHEWKKQLRGNISDSPTVRCLIYASYEAGNFIEQLPEPESAPSCTVLWTLYPDESLCFDPSSGHIYLAASSQGQLDALEVMLDQTSGFENIFASVPAGNITATSGEAYQAAVKRVKTYIAAGDVFQANIARFWRMPFGHEYLPALYGRLRQVNPAPFSCFARIESDHGLLNILSASPERLFRISADGRVDARPIAGTRKRGAEEQDAALCREMLLSAKERAEHIMLVDLERNDLGRVCIPGSVEVNERMIVERYATVQHIVSNVRGKLAEGKDAVDVFRAMFPGGTITGCPKVRCMEIIHELERQVRGPYTGGIGYVAWDGSADMNILIRSFWHSDGTLNWAAGAGIVADSDPAFELMETEHKAAGLLQALI
ncbi:MAG: hypothetical protein BMS9Abin18_0770 [Zetaproteobacteria bacterium]|nr:MAG: hypothetical protein BMS9Abin18_0770 [Zetaproteobacteria bacterium]